MDRVLHHPAARAAALPVLLVPLGSGAWAVTVRPTITGPTERLGTEAARTAAVAS